MTYPITEIGKVARFINGFPFKPDDWGSNGLPIIRIQNLTDPSKPYNFTTRKVPERYIVKQGDILISWSATIAVFEWENGDALLNQHIFKVEFDHSKINKQFFKKFLQKTITDLSRYAHGSTMKHVVKKDFENHKIPLPSLDSQINIAYLLSKVEELSIKRNLHIQKLDDLLKSVFLEMFGDPIRNANKLKIQPLGDFITHLTSGGRGWSKYYSESGKRFIRSLDVQMNSIGADDVVYVTPPYNKEAERTKVQSGDVLLTITGSKIGRACFVPGGFEEAYISQHVAIIRTEGIDPIYLSYYLSMPNCGQRIIAKNQYGQAKPGLNFRQIRAFDILVPDSRLQTQFVKIFHKVQRIKAQYTHSLEELANLYGSISQLAFKGELDLSKVPLTSDLEETVLPTTKPADITFTPDPVDPILSDEIEYVFYSPENPNDLDAPDWHIELLKKWLSTSWSAGSVNGGTFSLSNFISEAKEKLEEILEEAVAIDVDSGTQGFLRSAQLHAERFTQNNDSILGFPEYEELKKYVFEQLEQDSLSQVYDSSKNQIKVVV